MNSLNIAAGFIQLCFWIIAVYASDNKIPVVMEHNKQIRLEMGEHLRLECPVHSASSDVAQSTNHLTTANADNTPVMYHWRVRDRLDYMLDSDPRFRFSQNRRVLEIVTPVELSDSGTYTCTGITGFGKREVAFDVKVRGPNSDLLCAPQPPMLRKIKAPCFLDPILKTKPAITLERPTGSSVSLRCDADGTEPMRYRWLMGPTVADWVANSHGSRGPVLEIEQLRREHTGHYTCQVANSAGSLNYTYRLIVTDSVSATPKIITKLENVTLTNEMMASITAKIECACEEPVIQWLKRVEPEEEWENGSNDLALIPLPNARDTEKNERFRVLGSWDGSPAYIDPTIKISQPDVSSLDSAVSKPLSNLREQNSPSYMFLTRMHFTKPLDKEKHSGKYVLLTMRLSDVNSMEYTAIYVHITESVNFLKGRRILIYFLVPFFLLFIMIGMVSYIIIFRKRKSSTGISINDRSVMKTKYSSHPTYQIMSNGLSASRLKLSPSDVKFNSEHVPTAMGAKLPLIKSDFWQNVTTNGVDHISYKTDCGYPAVHYPHGSYQTGLCSGTSPQSNTTTTYLSSSQSTKRSLPIPPTPSMQLIPCWTDSRSHAMSASFEIANNQVVNGIMNNPNPGQVGNPFLTVNFTPNGESDTTCDQYSAVSRSPASSNNLTNHYTVPFNDHNREQLQSDISHDKARFHLN